MPELDYAAAVALLDVQPACPIAMTNKDGRHFDEDGDEIDARQTEPWVWALGPFGSWPCTLREAMEKLRAHTQFATIESLRIGRAVVYQQGWGFAAKPIPREVVYMALAEVLTQPLSLALLDPLDGAVLAGWRLGVHHQDYRWVAGASCQRSSEVIYGSAATIGEAVTTLATKLREMAASLSVTERSPSGPLTNAGTWIQRLIKERDEALARVEDLRLQLLMAGVEVGDEKPI